MQTTSKTILLADDDTSILTVLGRAMKNRGYEVVASEHLSDVDGWVREGLGDAVVTDVAMPGGNGLDGLKRWRALRPDLPVIVMSAHNTLLNAASAQEFGAVEFLPKPFDLEALLAVLDRVTQHRPAAPNTAQPPEGVVRISDTLTIVGKSKPMQAMFRTLVNLIGNDLTVLIHGESGTGKELIARALHALSKRKGKPFVALNMAAIPRELVESALFGHEKGAFTGAHQKQEGAFVQAQGGTLFLDEIGDMPMAAQTRLLRVLQEQEVTPIGAKQPVKTNVRIVAATHRDLKSFVTQGTFREDLYFRLHVVPLHLPGLRARADDIPLLVQQFLMNAERRGLARKEFHPDAMKALFAYHWPGNVRELEHLIYRLCAMTPSPVITARDVAPHLLRREHPIPAFTDDPVAHEPINPSLESFLQAQFKSYFEAHEGVLPPSGLYERVLARFEKPLIAQTLEATGGNQLKAAAILGINRNTLRKKIRALAIPTRGFGKQNAA